ncbi:MAG: hypothetical protein KTR23_05605 [Rhodospirillales bacterium]|nr:hypothetical protein [Rhodospirillales bacterium]
MRAVKVLVAFMGVLIVIGIGLVAYGLSLEKNSSEQGETATSQTPSVPVAGEKKIISTASPNQASQPIAPFGDITVDIKAGEGLIDYTVTGDQVTLHIEGPDGSGARLVIVSLTDKQVLGRILLETNGQ